MRRLFALILLLAAPAFAYAGVAIYRPATPYASSPRPYCPTPVVRQPYYVWVFHPGCGWRLIIVFPR